MISIKYLSDCCSKLHDPENTDGVTNLMLLLFALGVPFLFQKYKM